jgi:tetratricopeptide (TPR) repeat protein
LTGELPFDPKTLREGGLDHIRYIIREEEPKTPSIRLKTISGEESRKVAKLRRTDVRALGRKLHGDLDWITIKAMDKDRTRRYQTAQAMAEDIQRHLNHEPVLAGPPSTMYRLKKFVRRHRHSVTAAAVVIVSLVLGFIVSTVMYIQAQQARKKEAAALSEAQAVADFLTNDLLASVHPEKAKSPEVTVRYVLEAASKNLEGKFEGRPLVEAAIHEALGLTYQKLGDYKAAEPHLVCALEIRREQLGEDDKSTLAALSELGWLYVLQSRFEDAEPLLVEALEIKNRVLGEEHPDTLESMCELGWQYLYWMVEGRFDRAEALFVKVLEIGHRVLGKEHPVVLSAMRGLALRYIAINQFDKAGPLSTEGLEISRRALGKEHEVTLSFMNQLAWVYGEQGRIDEAVELAIEALHISQRVVGDEHPVTVESMNNLGWLYREQSRYDEATKLLSKSVELSWRVLGEGHLYTLLFTIRLVGLYNAQGQYDKMDMLLAKTLESSQHMLGQEHPLTEVIRSRLTERTRQLDLLGIKQYHTGEYDSALETFTRLEALCRTLNNEPSPSDMSFMAMAQHQLGHDQEAKTTLARLRRLVEDNKPTREEYLYEAEKLFASENSRLYSVWECIEAEKLNEALELIEQLQSLPRQEYIETAVGTKSAIKALSRAYCRRGRSVEHHGGGYKEAISDFEAAICVNPGCTQAYDQLASLLATCQINEFRDGARAIEYATKACEILRWKNHHYISTLAAAYAEADDYKSAIEWQKKAIDLLPENKRAIWQANYDWRLRLYQSGKPYHKGMVAWWKFDLTEGRLAVDSSDNGLDGKLVGGAHIISDSIRGNVLSLDGDGDYINCGNNPAFDITDSITIAARIKVNIFDKGWQAIVTKGDNA